MSTHVHGKNIIAYCTSAKAPNIEVINKYYISKNIFLQLNNPSQCFCHVPGMSNFINYDFCDFLNKSNIYSPDKAPQINKHTYIYVYKRHGYKIFVLKFFFFAEKLAICSA